MNFHPDINFDSFMKIHDNALTPDFCKHVCDRIESDTRKSLGVMGREKKKDITKKTSLDLRISSLPDWEEEDNTIYKSMSKYVDSYRDDLKESTGFPYKVADNEDFYSDSGYQVKVYDSDGFYDWHDDYQIDNLNGTRLLTCIWYLNDDFDEGETEFFNGTLIKPKTGRLLIFPATWIYIHRGRTVLNGKKYIATGWYFHKFPK
tara:strand:+ start:509 stop:1120 length:612 start_codon:yes stop_codon:yes gene_type:complete